MEREVGVGGLSSDPQISSEESVSWASGRTGAGHPGQQNGTLHGPADGVQYVHNTVLFFCRILFYLHLFNQIKTPSIET